MAITLGEPDYRRGSRPVEVIALLSTDLIEFSIANTFVAVRLSVVGTSLSLVGVGQHAETGER